MKSGTALPHPQLETPPEPCYTPHRCRPVDAPRRGKDAVLHSLAQSIRRHRLALPAILLLEVARPFAFVLSQALLVAGPLLDPLTRDAPRRLAGLLEDPHGLATLRDLLEAGPDTDAGKGG